MLIPEDLNRSVFSWSLEAIDHQINGKFPQELAHEFQKIFDYCKDYDMTYGLSKDKDDVKRKVDDLNVYIESNTVPNLTTIIQKYTNINIHKIHILSADDPTLYPVIFCSIRDIDNLLIRLLDRASGTGFDDQRLDVSQNKKLANILDMSYNLDRAKAKITAGYGGKKSKDGSVSHKEGLYISIGFNSAIFMLDELLIGGGKFTPTPQELAAVFLHEIGHTFSWIEYAADLSFTGYYGNSVMRNIKDKFKKEPGKTLDEVIDFLNDADTKKRTPSHMIKLTHSLAELGTELKTSLATHYKSYDDMTLSSIIEQPSSVFAGVFVTLFNLLLFGVIHLLTAIVIIENTLIAAVFLPIMKDVLRNNSLDRNRGIAYNSNAMYERLADEYVSRYQMSKHLNTALTKLNGLFFNISRNGFMPITSRVLRESMILKLYTAMIMLPEAITATILIAVTEDYGNYESDHKRAQRNINNLRDLLKNSSLPGDVRNEILKDIDTMTADMNKFKPRIYHIFTQAIKRIVLLPSKLVRTLLSGTVGDANIDRELQKLSADIDELLSNKAYYYAAKIKSIFG